MAENSYICTLCMRHCPVEALACGQGRKAAERGGWGIQAVEMPEKYWKGMDELAPLLERCGRAVRGREGLGNGQERILDILAKREGMTQKKIQEMLEVKPGSISEILAKLEAKNLVARERDPEDRRMVTLRLTDKGRIHLRSIKRKSGDELLFSALTQEERRQLHALLLKLRDGWRKEAEDRGKNG